MRRKLQEETQGNYGIFVPKGSPWYAILLKIKTEKTDIGELVSSLEITTPYKEGKRFERYEFIVWNEDKKRIGTIIEEKAWREEGYIEIDEPIGDYSLIESFEKELIKLKEQHSNIKISLEKCLIEIENERKIAREFEATRAEAYTKSTLPSQEEAFPF